MLRPTPPCAETVAPGLLLPGTVRPVIRASVSMFRPPTTTTSPRVVTPAPYVRLARGGRGAVPLSGGQPPRGDRLHQRGGGEHQTGEHEPPGPSPVDAQDGDQRRSGHAREAE